MPSFSPLKPGDPERLGPYRLLGRLGEGGQGVVYLATDSTGAHVAVKWLRSELAGDAVSIERFMREVQVAEQVAPFCTAAVLAKGVEYERPYIVSEFIDGPPLQRVVTEQGPRTGSSLHRLAIGTATALAAIHQAGIVHRDFKPANVILGADGPRVIDFGIARALNATSTLTSMAVGTPSYMPPEQFMGHPVGPTADLFSWAGTMVFAATGRAPFGSDTMPAVINRVLNQQPDLGTLDGPLRDVVAACLSKDPAQRPTAEQVIMRLLANPVPTGGMLAQGAAAAGVHPHGPAHQPATPSNPWGPPTPTTYHNQPHLRPPQQPPRRSSKAPLLIGISVAVSLLLLGGVALAIPWNSVTTASPTNTKSSTKSGTKTGTKTSEPPRSPETTPPVEVRTKTSRLPGGLIWVHEKATDPITLTSYEIYNKNTKEWVDYARNGLTGTFKRYPNNEETLLSPDGGHLASRGRNYTSDGYDYIVITDRKTAARSTIKTVPDPEVSSIVSWSKDSRRILLNIEKKIGGKWSYLGFAVVDVETAKVTTVKVNDAEVRQSGYGWDEKEEGAVAVIGKDKGLRFFGLNGKRIRDAPGVGVLPSGMQDVFSPDGSKFVTNCPGGRDGDHCLWEAASGERVRRFSSACDKVLGWYDDTHLFCWEQDDGQRDEIQVVGFDGKLTRKLLDIAGDVQFSPTFTVNPANAS